MSTENWITTLIGVASAFGAAYAGSHFAFKFERAEKIKDKEKEQSEAANKVMGAMIRQVNSLINIRDQHIKPYRENPFRCVLILPILERNPEHYRIDFEQVSYMLATIHRNHYFAMLTEADKFNEVINSINHRSKFHQEIIQLSLKAAGVKEGVDILAGHLKQAIGEIDFVTITRLTDQMITAMDDAIKTIKANLDESHHIFKQLFPTREFLKVAWDEVPIKYKNDGM